MAVAAAHGAPGMAAPVPSHTTHPARSPVLFPVLWSRPGALEAGLGSRAVPTGSGSGWCSPGLWFLWDTGAVCDLEAVAGACCVPDFQMTLGRELQPRIPGTTRTALTPPHWHLSLIYLPGKSLSRFLQLICCRPWKGSRGNPPPPKKGWRGSQAGFWWKAPFSQLVSPSPGGSGVGGTVPTGEASEGLWALR